METNTGFSLGGLGALSNMEGLDLTTVDTNYPVLESNIYGWKILSAKYEPSKSKPVTESLVIELATLTEAKDKNGKVVPAGYKQTAYIGLTPTFELLPGTQEYDFTKPKRTAENIFRDVASVLDAVYGEAGRKRINLGTFDIANLFGQEVKARTSISPEENGYPEKTRISRWIKKEDGLPDLPAPGAVASPAQA